MATFVARLGFKNTDEKKDALLRASFMITERISPVGGER